MYVYPAVCTPCEEGSYVMAEEAGLSCSQVLQEALTERPGLRP